MTQLWAVQTRLLQEDATLHLVDAFQKLGLNWAAFPFPPFIGRVPDFDWDGPIVYYGSTGLVKRVADPGALARNPQAALFFNHLDHKPSCYATRLGDAYLNHNGYACSISDFLDDADPSPRFIRPNSGLKVFAGGVFDPSGFKDFYSAAQANGLQPATTIWVAEPQTIEREFRTWVVDSEVVAVVGYKIGSKILPWYEPEDSPTLAYIKAFAAEQAKKLTHLGAYVLDICITPDGLRVIEINCIHSAGFYLTEHIIDVVRELSNFVARNEKAAANPVTTRI